MLFDIIIKIMNLFCFKKYLFFTAIFFALFFISINVSAATRTWDGGGTTNNWSEAANWSDNIVPGSSDNVIFSASSTKNSVWDSAGPTQIASLNVQSNYSGSLTLGRDVSVSGNWTFSGSGSLNVQTSTLKFVGYSSNFTSGPVNYYTIEMAKNGIYADLTIIGQATTTNLIITSGDEILTGTLNVLGNITITATTYGGGSGTINISGTGDQTLSSAGWALPNVTINKPSGTLYLSGTIPIKGNWTWQSGDIDVQTSTLKFVGYYTKNFTSGPYSYYNVEIAKSSNSYYTNMSSDLIISNNLDITRGYFVQTNYDLQVNNTITVSQNGAWKNYSTSTTSYVYVGSGGVDNNGFIDFNGGSDSGCAGSDLVLIRSTANGIKRPWSGIGTFWMRDVDVKDQGQVATIVVAQGTNSGNNGSNWIFDNDPLNYIYKADLTSSIFDSQTIGGNSLNSIMFTSNLSLWLGSLVKFQIASSNASSGPWSFIGPDGTNLTYYAPSSYGTYYAVPINPSHHNNKRYFRYKMFLQTDSCRSISPKVKGVNINWGM